jgi:L-lactate utilization protein LutB
MCSEVCAAKINLPDHLLTLRNKVVETKNNAAFDRFAFKIYSWLLTKPALYRTAAIIPALLQRLLPKDKPFPVPGYSGKREFTTFDVKGFRKRFKEMQNK